jgi:hypothetical protein
MYQMSTRDLEQHTLILGWLYLVGHAVFLAVGAFIFVLLAGIGAATGEAEALTILSVVGISAGALLGLLAVPGLLAGYGLLKHKPWARVLAMVVGILSLVNFPVGTAIGIYTLWVLTQPSAADYFAAPA